MIVPENKLLGDLPPDVANSFRHAEIWKTIDIQPGVNYAGLDANAALADIASQGYHAAGAYIDVIEQWPGDRGAG